MHRRRDGDEGAGDGSAGDVESASTTGGLPVAPALGPSLEAARVPVETRPVDARVVVLCGLAIVLGVAAGFVAQTLTALIALLTNVAFFGSLSTTFRSPAENHLGAWVIVVPVAGAIVVGVMARYGSKAIRGHGIPEAMEQVLANQSRVPPRMTLLKPLSAAVAIGTGGPFGAEGPIIATGGALGSLVGQVLRTTANERKTLLAAGAAAGMAAIFGTPVAAVLLAVELLLFEFRARSIIPVSLAACTATAVHIVFNGNGPTFAMPDLDQPGSAALVLYVAVGALTAVAAVGVTRAVYFVEGLFERLTIHWMWWPAIGGVAVGVVGFVSPRTLGVGYDNIEDVLAARSPLTVVAALCAWKFVSWSIALGSGTSGGTLAPLFTMGGGLGAVLGTGLALAFPAAGIDVRIAALVGMAAMFAGASRAALASVVFAFETTRQPIGLLPLLGGCTASHLISGLLMRHTIMTEKIAKRGLRVASDYTADFLDQVLVRDRATRHVVTLPGSGTVDEARNTILAGGPGTAHQGFPVVAADGRLLGVVTRRDLFGNFTDRALPLVRVLTRPPVVIFGDSSLREAADHMVRENVGRLVVVPREDPTRVVGILTRSDLLEAHRRRIDDAHRAERGLALAGR